MTKQNDRSTPTLIPNEGLSSQNESVATEPFSPKTSSTQLPPDNTWKFILSGIGLVSLLWTLGMVLLLWIGNPNAFATTAPHSEAREKLDQLLGNASPESLSSGSEGSDLNSPPLESRPHSLRNHLLEELNKTLNESGFDQEGLGVNPNNPSPLDPPSSSSPLDDNPSDLSKASPMNDPLERFKNAMPGMSSFFSFPSINVKETDTAYEIRVPLNAPGDEKNVHVKVVPNFIEVQAQLSIPSPNGQGSLGNSSVMKSFSVSHPVDPKRMSQRLESTPSKQNGQTLVITLPKITPSLSPNLTPRPESSPSNPGKPPAPFNKTQPNNFPIDGYI
ncbi:MAG: Hsp20/alpha crystallin family protein [Cyanobacteria bacterium]|nr:Hsp20/alpha crystallin family protein [Cyanobacteriota bacterium]